MKPLLSSKTVRDRDCKGRFVWGRPTKRFWSQVKIVLDKDSCWERKHIKFRVNGKGVLASRYSWELKYGPIPKGMLVCHKCDNPPCVRPSHLFLGTDLDNRLDAVEKGRQAKGSQNGKSILTEREVLKIRKSNLSRRKLAEKYGVSYCAIIDVLLRRTWKHLEIGGSK